MGARFCSAGYGHSIHWNSVPASIHAKRIDPTKKYCVVSEGNVILDTDDYHEANAKFIEICKAKHGQNEPIHEKITLAKQKIVDGVVEDVGG